MMDVLIEICPMKYAEITSYPRAHNTETHPIIGHILIEAEHWSGFERALADQTQATVLGHDEAGNDMITAHVACTTDTVLDRLTDRWSA